ncbi:hypothetical protein [uncultured Winogradskyella sp.]|uniref:hypothetical protein n=1 Tax=uncultured Winogradskyella sp. TaxID=395353 RepID=UPI002605DA46|nr:hypothetical protein [uncultured Winogradskyella sp.]
MNLPEGFHREVIEARKNTVEDNNDIKSQVSTSPLSSGGASFKTHVLIRESSSKLVYKPSIGVAIFCFIFLAVGLGVLFFNTIHLFKSNFDFEMVNWFLIIFGLIFSSVGGFMFYSFYKPRVFDKQLGFYYKAYKPEIHNRKNNISKSHVLLKSIIAIQLIGEHIKSDKGSYKSFELNLVLDDASRKNVVDHGSLKSIIDDAQILSDFLYIPIWHAKSDED